MSKLTDDPKVQALLTKERAAAHKALHNHLKAHFSALEVPPARTPELKVHKALIKGALAASKEFAAAA